MTGYVALEVDPYTFRPAMGSIMGWGLTRKEALIEAYDSEDVPRDDIKTFRWDGPEEPDGQDVWEYDQKTGIVRSA